MKLIFYSNNNEKDVLGSVNIDSSSESLLFGIFLEILKSKKRNIDTSEIIFKRGGGVIKHENKKIKDFKLKNNEELKINVLYKMIDNMMIIDEEDKFKLVSCELISANTEMIPNYFKEKSEGVFGMDTRIVVSAENQMNYNYNKIFKIISRFTSKEILSGSCFLISNSILLTAAHCLYDNCNGCGFAKQIYFIDNKEKTFLNKIKKICVLEKYILTDNKEYDIGFIVLEEPFKYNDLFFNLKIDNNNLSLNEIIICGYPQDKKYEFMHAIGKVTIN